MVSVASNLVPERMVALTDAALAGKMDEAEKLDEDLEPLYSAEFIETNPIPIKAGMNLAGMSAGGYRLPMCEMMPEAVLLGLLL